MNIYLIQRNSEDEYRKRRTGLEIFVSFVAIAEDENSARKMCPDASITHVTDGKWMSRKPTNGEEYTPLRINEEWVPYSKIGELEVTLLGKALGIEVPRVVCAETQVW